jgi:hypothetical protein
MQNKKNKRKDSMTKEKRMTLNAEKRKVIADQFQSFYEDKVKDKLIQAKQQYDLMREKAKEQIEKVVRFHQPQEDVDTIRRMISKYNRFDNVIKEHQQLYSYVEKKMKTLRLGLKSYRFYDQAKELADKVGVVLNETMMNESSSLALSIYSPENLASLLEDKEKQDNADIIARFKRGELNQAIN